MSGSAAPIPAPAPPAGSLAAAVALADDQATVLDDRLDLENRAIFRWLRAHELDPRRFGHLVLGVTTLPAGWPVMVLRSRAEAERLLRPALRHPAALRTLRRLGQQAFPAVAGMADAALVSRIAAGLVDGTVWAIRADHAAKSRFAGKTAPAAFDGLNPKYRTSVDFAFIAGLEGDQRLRGYVPIDRDGVVIGGSGMTVASGFDVGQRTERELGALGFTPALLAKLTPYADHPFNGRHKKALVAEIGSIGPVPVLTKAEADACDTAVFGKILADSIADWDRGRTKGVPAFTDLPAGWQTVWLSRNYQEGRRTKVAAGVLFRAAALAGQWPQAVAHLRAYTQYTKRAAAEAALLAAKLPPPLNPPKP